MKVKNHDYTFQEIREMLGKLTVSQIVAQKEAKERAQEFDKRLNSLTEKFKENEKRFAENEARFEKRFAENEVRFEKSRKENQENIDAMRNDIKKSIKELSVQIGGVGNSNGDYAEEFFFQSFDNKVEINGVKYNYIEQNKKRKINNLMGEYDIVLFNTTKILVVEVKYKLKREQVDKFCEKSMPKFKKLFPELKDYSVNGAFASFSFEKGARESAAEKGILIFTQSGKNIKKLSPENLELSEF